MNQKARNTTIAGIFTLAVLLIGFVGFSDALFNSTDLAAEKTQDSSELAVKNITQTASASSHCPGYSSSFGGGSGSTCYRSGSTTFTVVLGASTSTVDAVDDPSPTTVYEVEEGGSFQASSSGSNPGVLANDTPGGISGLSVQSWDTSGVQGTISNTQDNNGNFDYTAPSSIAATTTTTFNYTATDGTDTDTATATIEIQPTNTCPTLNDETGSDAYTVTAGEEITNRDVSINDDPHSLDYSVVNGPSDGTLTLDNDGTFDYDHDGGSTSTDSFTYSVDGCSNQATAEIKVNNKKPVAQIDGPDPSPVNYCSNTSFEFDGGSSYDQDGTDIITSYSWGITSPGSLTSASGQTTSLTTPVDWATTTDISLQVEDDEGSTDSTTETVSVNTPDYKINVDEPDDNRLWITASSTKRSTKATIKVTDINTDPNFSYGFDDLTLEFPEKSGVPESAFQVASSTADETFTFWVKPQDSSQELAFGTYDIEASIQLKLHDSPPCTYTDPATDIELRAQTTAEF